MRPKNIVYIDWKVRRQERRQEGKEEQFLKRQKVEEDYN